ncbi:hypothetical protein [Stagnihabitans tardus]|uniref:Uncharacterized protein n=1 Tax=Stagnihabitans tardus TaxID=2699202 RepID=A0AAE4YB12_9RHOB|nr:hypothetical protein [Stagnihabitans tardus]NBZ88151.1 hypothetical protein [Stagnihabitans tardus]
MKPTLIALALGAAALPALADTTDVVALWGEHSGSVAPEYAWSYTVSFQLDGLVRAEYCKGYADEAPGCATSTKQLSDAEIDALDAAVLALAEDMKAHPPKPVSPEEMAIGGGSTFGWIWLGDEKFDLPGQPRKTDAARVAAMLRVLQEHTPPRLVQKAETKAKAP